MKSVLQLRDFSGDFGYITLSQMFRVRFRVATKYCFILHTYCCRESQWRLSSTCHASVIDKNVCPLYLQTQSFYSKIHVEVDEVPDFRSIVKNIVVEEVIDSCMYFSVDEVQQVAVVDN